MYLYFNHFAKRETFDYWIRLHNANDIARILSEDSKSVSDLSIRRSAVPKQNAACKLCGDASHDTFSHGRITHLCFNCRASGHRASVCSTRTANKPTSSTE